MKRILFLLLLVVSFLPGIARAQQGNTVIIQFPGVPTGSCSGISIATNGANGHFYDCFAGAWLDVTGAGGGTAFSTLTAGTNSNAGTFAFSGNTLDLSSATSFIPPNGWFQTNTVANTTQAGLNLVNGTSGAGQIAVSNPSGNNVAFNVANVAGGGGSLTACNITSPAQKHFLVFNGSSVCVNQAPGVVITDKATVNTAGYPPVALDLGNIIIRKHSGAMSDAPSQGGSAGFPIAWYTSLCITDLVNSDTITPTTSTINTLSSIVVTPNTCGNLIVDAGNNYRFFGFNWVKPGTGLSPTYNADGSTTLNATGHSISALLNCSAASASGTAYTCTTTPTFVPADGDAILFEADVANTGATTLNANSSSAAPVKKQGGGTALVANDLLAGQDTVLVFDGTNWQMQGLTGNASGGGTPCTTTAISLQYNNAGAFGCVAEFTYASSKITGNTTTALAQFFGLKNTTAAVVGTSQGSPIPAFCGRAWTGSDVEDCLTIQDFPGNGVNAPITFLFAHTGTSTGQVDSTFPGPIKSGGTTAGFAAYGQNPTSAAIEPCNAANTDCEQGAAAITASVTTRAGVKAQGIIAATGNSSAIQILHSGDAGHSTTVTTGSGTSVGSTSFCSTVNCPVGTYLVNAYLDITTACTTTGTYSVSLVYTDDQGSKTIVIPMQGPGETAGVLNLATVTNFGQAAQVLRSTGAASINYLTTAAACGSGGPMVGKLYLSVVPVQ